MADRGPGVIRAVYDMEERHQRPPTVEEVAEYLELEVDAVSKELRRLQDKRIFRLRKRKAGTVVVRWGR